MKSFEILRHSEILESSLIIENLEILQKGKRVGILGILKAHKRSFRRLNI